MTAMYYITVDWSLIYLQDVYGWDPNEKGATYMTIFTACYMVSRLLLGIIGNRLSVYLMYYFCLGLNIYNSKHGLKAFSEIITTQVAVVFSIFGRNRVFLYLCSQEKNKNYEDFSDRRQRAAGQRAAEGAGKGAPRHNRLCRRRRPRHHRGRRRQHLC